jgi:hypothetical protein
MLSDIKPASVLGAYRKAAGIALPFLVVAIGVLRYELAAQAQIITRFLEHTCK